MARTKIDYGIDLGTTNSAIARMENGNPIIKKSVIIRVEIFFVLVRKFSHHLIILRPLSIVSRIDSDRQFWKELKCHIQ